MSPTKDQLTAQLATVQKDLDQHRTRLSGFDPEARAYNMTVKSLAELTTKSSTGYNRDPQPDTAAIRRVLESIAARFGIDLCPTVTLENTFTDSFYDESENVDPKDQLIERLIVALEGRP